MFVSQLKTIAIKLTTKTEMQTESQIPPQIADTPKKGKGHTRKPDEGNILWKLYCELGRTRLAEFKELLKKAGIKFNTFIAHTGRTKQLSNLQPEQLATYRGFFLESNVDLADVMANEVKAAKTQEG